MSGIMDATVANEENCDASVTGWVYEGIETQRLRKHVKSKRKKLLLPDWLRCHLNSHTFKSLQWEDSVKDTFSIKWVHKSRSTFQEDDFEVFDAWAKHSEKRNKVKDACRKANFRCALNSCRKDIKLIKKEKSKQIYQFRKKSNDPWDEEIIKTKKKRKRKKGYRSTSVEDYYSDSSDEFSIHSSPFNPNQSECSSRINVKMEPCSDSNSEEKEIENVIKKYKSCEDESDSSVEEHKYYKPWKDLNSQDWINLIEEERKNIDNLINKTQVYNDISCQTEDGDFRNLEDNLSIFVAVSLNGIASTQVNHKSDKFQPIGFGS